MVENPVRITFVGNEGVVVATDAGTVAIDALFGRGAASFTITPGAVIEAMEAARAPFDNIDIVLATHYHPDHFDARSVERHLTASTGTRLVTTEQAAALFEEKSEAFASLSDRIFTVEAADGVRESLTIGDIRVDSFGLSHGRVNFAHVQQAGFIVHAGGKTVVHLGDGIIDERSLAGAGLFDEPIDAAFLPFWYFTYPVGQRLLESRFRTGRLFAVHIPPARGAVIEREIASAFPHATALVRAMAQYSIE